MDKRIIEQEFLEIYGYRGDRDELEYFAADRGYRYDEPYLNYEQLRYHSQGGSKQYGSMDSTAGDVGNLKDEVGALFREIFNKAKKEKAPEASHELITEFAYMALLFLLKSSLYFALRFGQEQGFCCNL